ncbi:gluconate dehydrogenase subunit [Bordetella ansorpii]|uniref:Gluconate dehydrogenase subunit n=1 Tax=Bordetella ansorpii TaxID=288768 RepID=A0A157R0C3_9BORD|nr:GMC family oxidoreductase [Bordetella ansorpii]SAI51398.1 gluconate dehydrogenase subunit [Bordetella ansorpii]
MDYDTDLLVIGSGVMGSVLAARVAKAGKSVTILEAGPRVTRSEIVERFRNAPIKLSLTNIKLQGAGSPFPNPPHIPSTYGDYLQQSGPVKYPTKYLRVVGGTTWHFGSALWRMIPNDFKIQTLYGQGRDWPMTYDELEPYYNEAEEELGVSGVNGQDEGGWGRGEQFPPRSKPFPMEGLPIPYFQQRLAEQLKVGGYHPIYEPNGRATRAYKDRPICSGNNNCNPVCPSGAKYDGTRHVDEAERHGARVLDNCVVYKIEADDRGKIVAVRYKKPDGSEHRMTARYFVLAAYGIESPKLLLMSTSEKYPNGIANSSDQVGRNLMGHTGIAMNVMASEDLWPGQGPTELLVYMNYRDGEFRKTIPSYKTKLRNTVATSSIADGLMKKGVYGSKLNEEIRTISARSLNFAVDFETNPLPQNRVTPSKTKRDALGLPLPEIYYSVDDYWNAGRDFAVKDLQKMAALINGRIDKMDTNHQDRQHIMGTTIMGADPKTSVVDKDGRAHDHDNLFIVGTNVMPAMGCVNPTLTGVAVTLRTTDVLLKEI